MPNTDETAVSPTPPPAAPPADPRAWWGRFHLCAFLHLTMADRHIQRRELVWIKRFFEHQRLPRLIAELDDMVRAGEVPEAEFDALTERARGELSKPERRRFVYNLAQLCKSKGAIGEAEYDSILDLAERLGVRETDADQIINSVFSINDSFAAIVGVLAIGVMLYFTRSVIVPLVFALFITMIINKVESLITRTLKRRRFLWVDKIAAMVLILGGVVLLFFAAAKSGGEVATKLPHYEAKGIAALQSVNQLLQRHGIDALDRAGVIEQVGKLPIGSTLSGFLGSLFDIIGNVFLVVIFTGFLVFSSSRFEGTLQEMNEKITAYISVKTLISFLTGLCAFVLAWLFGLDFALFWAILVFLLNYIPSVGSIIATIPPILLAMVQFDSWAAIIAFAIGMIGIQMLFGQVLEPKLMGDKLAVKPVALLLGLILWGFLWGLPGMFLAAPLMALLKILASYFNFSRPLERLLSAD